MSFLYILFSVCLTSVARVWAQSSANLFAVNFPIVAYVVASEADVATTYLVGCQAGTETSSCNFAQPYTLIEGPKTVSFEFTAPLPDSTTQSFTLGCSLDGTTSMGCSATGLSDESPAAPVTTSEAMTYTGNDAATFFKPIALVAHSTSLLTYTPGSTSTQSPVTTSTASTELTSETTDANLLAAAKITAVTAVTTTASISPTKKSSATQHYSIHRGEVLLVTLVVAGGLAMF